MHSEKQTIFFSNKNYYMVFNILRKDIKKKFNYTINDDDNIFKRELFKIMNIIFTEKSEKLSLIDINKSVLKKTAAKYLKIIKNSKKKKNDVPSSLSYHREIDINKKEISYINTRPESASNIENKGNIETDFKTLSKNREIKGFKNKKDFEKLLNSKEIMIQENTEKLYTTKIKERSNNVKDMNNYNQSLEIFNKNMEEQKNKINGEVKSIKQSSNISAIKETDNNILISKHPNNMDGDLSQIDKRNIDKSDFMKNNKDVDRAIIFRKNLEVDTIENEKKVFMETPVIKEVEFIKKEKTHLLEISSLNRNWINIPNLKQHEKENRFRFQVDFAPSLNSDVKIPIYENNPFTLKNLDTPLQNISENTVVNSSDIIKNKDYDSNKDLGNIVNYIYKKMYGSQNAYIMERFRNISEINLISVTMPFEYKYNRKESLGANTSTLYSYPYILLHIEEFDGVYQSTNNVVNNCFCKLIPGKEIETESFSYDLNEKHNSRIKFIIMKPDTVNHKLIFSQAPIASLNKLSIRLLSPTGESIGSSMSDNLNIPKDNFNIKSVDISDDYKKFIITTEKYFYPSLFIKDDILLIQELELSKDTDNCNYFEKFINRKSGHFMVEKCELNEGGYCNKIVILTEGKFNDLEGKWNPLDWVKNFRKLDIGSIITGKIINMSKQINLLFSIKTIENDTQQIISKIV